GNKPERGDLGGNSARVLADQRDGDRLAGGGAQRREACRRRRGCDDRREPQLPSRIFTVCPVARGYVQDPARNESSATCDGALNHGQLTGGHDVGGERYSEQRDGRVAELP